MDRLTLVELIEAEKAKLSPEAQELWESLYASLYLGPDEETRFKPHERALVDDMAYLPEVDQHVINVLSELRAGLYQSDYSERLGEPSEPHRDRCVILAAAIKDRGRANFTFRGFSEVRLSRLLGSRGPQPYRGGPTNSESYFWFISSTVLARSASSPCSARA